MQNTGLDEAQAGVKTARRKINNLRYAGDTTLMVENEEELKSLLMKVRGERKKLALSSTFKKKKNGDHGIQFHHCMPNRWGKQWKQ